MFLDLKSNVSASLKKVACFEKDNGNSVLDLKSRNYLNFYTFSVNS